ncbi:hypothetical protein BDZ45DRAFT_64299 [Acephala macrosclerotiorum]|nr:hypothetical protein BDZ45DRAFT_64299 [Acephala macrosclerotiorum]
MSENGSDGHEVTLSLMPKLNDKSSNDLCLLAVENLDEEDKASINFSYDKLTTLSDLTQEVQQAQTSCFEKRWTFKRKNGEKVILRDVFGKFVKWINLFKEAGDVAVSYDPGHAALPWALVRVLLQVAVGDIEKYAFVVDSLEDISRCICRCTLLERLYLNSSAAATHELRVSLVKTYGAILHFLFTAKRFFNANTGIRIIASAFKGKADHQSLLDETKKFFDEVEKWALLVSREDSSTQDLELRELLKRYNEPVLQMSSWIEGIHDNLEQKKRQEILNWISEKQTIDYFKHHKENKRDILKGTGQWLLQDPVFKNWKDDSASSLLWLHGIPGSGKSKLTSLVIEDGIRISSQGLGPRPAFVYCSRSPAEPGRSDPLSIISSIARQISILQPSASLLLPVVQKYLEEEVAQDASPPSRLDVAETQELIIELVNLRPLTVVIIDALDECSREDRRIMFDFIKSTIENSSSIVKFFISSREDEDIVFRLQSFLNMEISSTKNGADVKAFVVWETERLIAAGTLLRGSQKQNELRDLVIRKVAADSDGMFRWASLQLQNLTTLKTDEDICDQLGKIPPTLEELYAEIYKLVTQNRGSVAQAISRNIFSVILGHRYPLSELGFRDLIRVNSNQVSTSQILDICCNLVVLDKTSHVFRFAHLSVQEFLLRATEFSSPTLIHSTISSSWLLRFIEAETDGKKGRAWTELGSVLESQRMANGERDKTYGIYEENLIYHLKKAGAHERTSSLFVQELAFFQKFRYDYYPAWLPDPNNSAARCLWNSWGLGFPEIVIHLVDSLGNQQEPHCVSSIRSEFCVEERSLVDMRGRVKCIPLDIGRLQQIMKCQDTYQILARYSIYLNDAEGLKLLLDRKLCEVSKELLLEAIELPQLEKSRTISILLRNGAQDVLNAFVRVAIEKASLHSSGFIIQELLDRGLRVSMTKEFQSTVEVQTICKLETCVLLIEADKDCVLSRDFMQKAMDRTNLPDNILERLLRKYNHIDQVFFEKISRRCHSWGPLDYIAKTNVEICCTPVFLYNLLQNRNITQILSEIFKAATTQDMWQLVLTQQVLAHTFHALADWDWEFALLLLHTNPKFDLPKIVILMAFIIDSRDDWRRLEKPKRLYDLSMLGDGSIQRMSKGFDARQLDACYSEELMALVQLKPILHVMEDVLNIMLENWSTLFSLLVSDILQEDKAKFCNVPDISRKGKAPANRVLDDDATYGHGPLSGEASRINNSLKDFLASWKDILTFIDLGGPVMSDKPFGDNVSDEDIDGQRSHTFVRVEDLANNEDGKDNYKKRRRQPQEARNDCKKSMWPNLLLETSGGCVKR